MISFRNIFRWLSACLLVFIITATFSACRVWQVTPPEDVRQPARVFLSEYGKHTSVAFPVSGNGYVEFGFGEWHYYGMEEHGIGSSLRALGGGGRGALSKREIAFSGSAEMQFAQVAKSDRSMAIDVEWKRMRALRTALEGRWEASDEQVVRTHDGLEVRSDPEAYRFFRNSNKASAKWLEEMGAEVRGTPVLSNFRIVEG